MPKRSNIGETRNAKGLTPDTEEAFAEYIMKNSDAEKAFGL
jgi:hypothetical protein